MVKFNKINNLKGVFIDEYTKQVALRKDLKYWKLPKKFEKQVDPVVNHMMNYKINTPKAIKLFVKLQFDGMISQKCMQFFKLVYPPLGTFKNEVALRRYNAEINSQSNSELKKQTNIAHIIMSEYSRSNSFKTGNINLDQLQLCIVNKLVSGYTVAYMMYKFELSAEVCSELSYVHKITRGESLINHYKTVTDLIQQGELE
jgi:hypothetical protein